MLFVIFDLALVIVVIVLLFLIINKLLTHQPSLTTQMLSEKVKGAVSTIVPKADRKKADLSYILVTVNDKNSQLNLIDETEKKAGEVILEEPIRDVLDLSTNTVGALNALYFAKPASGIYSLEVKLTKNSFIDIYLYDRGVGSKMKTIEGKKGELRIKINFDKDNANNSSLE